MNLICLVLGCKEAISKYNTNTVEFTCKRCDKVSVNYILKKGD